MRRRFALLALLPAALPGCDALGPDCTQIGCTSGVRVTFASAPTQAYRIELLLGDEATVPAAVVECTRADGRCPPVFFALHVPGDRARLRVTTAAGSIITAARVLTYDRSRPNGPGCPPTCYLATLEATLPAPATSGDRSGAAI